MSEEEEGRAVTGLRQTQLWSSWSAGMGGKAKLAQGARSASTRTSGMGYRCSAWSKFQKTGCASSGTGHRWDCCSSVAHRCSNMASEGLSDPSSAAAAARRQRAYQYV